MEMATRQLCVCLFLCIQIILSLLCSSAVAAANMDFPNKSTASSNPHFNDIRIPAETNLDKFIFSADDGIHGFEPWIFDFNSDTTWLLRDMEPGLDGSYPSMFTPILAGDKTFRGFAFLTTDWMRINQSLWFTDEDFTVPQQFGFPSSAALQISEVVSFVGGPIFVAAAEIGGPNFEPQLYRCIIAIPNLQCTLVDSNVKRVARLTVFPEVGVFFQCATGDVMNPAQLCAVRASDSFQSIRFQNFSASGASVLEPSEIVFHDGPARCLWFIFQMSGMFFIGKANDAWIDYFPHTGSVSSYYELTVVGDRLYFINSSIYISYLFANGTSATLGQMVFPSKLFAAGSILFFAAIEQDSPIYNDLAFYSFDGETLKCFPTKANDPYFITARGRPLNGTTSDGEIFVIAHARSNMTSSKEFQTLFYRGTKDGFVEYNIFAPNLNDDLYLINEDMAIFRGHLLLGGNLPGFGVEMLEWDGTSLKLVSDVNKIPVSPQVSDLVPFEDKIFFSAWTSNTGNELFLWDGDSVSLVSDIIPGPVSSFPTKFTLCSGTLYFLAYNTSLEAQKIVAYLWSLKDRKLQSYQLASDASFLTCMNGNLIFSDKSEIRYFPSSQQYSVLINSFGMDTGPMSQISTPLNGKLFFFVDSLDTLELWSTDLAVTQNVALFPNSMVPISQFWVFGNSLYFLTDAPYPSVGFFRFDVETTTLMEVHAWGIKDKNIISTPDYMLALNSSSFLFTIDGSQDPPEVVLDPFVRSVWPLSPTQILFCSFFECEIRNRSAPFAVEKKLSNSNTDVNPQIWYGQYALILKNEEQGLRWYRIEMKPGNPAQVFEVYLPNYEMGVTSMKSAGDQLFVESYSQANQKRFTFMIPLQDLLHDNSDSQISSSQISSSPKKSTSQSSISHVSSLHSSFSEDSSFHGSNSHGSSSQERQLKSTTDDRNLVRDAAIVAAGVGLLLVLCLISITVLVIFVCLAACCLRMRKSKNFDQTQPLELQESTTSSQTSTVRSPAVLADSSNSSSSSSKTQITISIDTSKWTDINMQEIEIQSRLGTGAYGIVYKAKYRADFVALKKLKDMDSYVGQEEMNNVIQEFTREITILAQLRHVNVLFFYGACTTFPNLAIVTEFMEKGSLYDLLYKAKEELPFLTRLSIAFDIAKGVAYLHSQQVVHRDLKSHNCLIGKSYIAKVADFGMSRIRDAADRHSMTSNVGSVLWMAPEVALGEKYDSQVDVFSFGIILSELLTMRVPYSDLDQQTQQMIHFKIATREDLRPTVPEPEEIFQETMTRLNREISELGREAYKNTISEFIILMTKCWKKSPSDRPTFMGIVPTLDSLYSSIAEL